MKNSENTQLDQLLKNKLAEGATEVPDFVWDRIEEELFPKKKKRGFFWWFLCGSFIVLLGCFIRFFSIGSVHFQSGHNHEKQYTHQVRILHQNPLPNVKKTRTVKTLATLRNQHKTSKNKHHSFGKATVLKKTEEKFFRNTRISSLKDGSNPTSGTNNLLTPNQREGQNTPLLINNSGVPSNKLDVLQENKDQTKIQETKKGSIPNTIAYGQILEMIKTRFGAIKQESTNDLTASSNFSIGLYGGSSLYDIAVFKDYFSSGQLSSRTFASSGFETGFNAYFNVGKRFNIYSGLAFSQKQTQFNYNLAITESDYFTHLVHGHKIPLANIVDDGVNSCFLVKGVTAKYTTTSILLSLGATFEFWKKGKFSAATNVRLACNVQSAMKLHEVSILDIQQPKAE